MESIALDILKTYKRASLFSVLVHSLPQIICLNRRDRTSQGASLAAPELSISQNVITRHVQRGRGRSGAAELHVTQC